MNGKGLSNIGFGGRAHMRRPTWGWPQRHAHSARRRAQRCADMTDMKTCIIALFVCTVAMPAASQIGGFSNSSSTVCPREMDVPEPPTLKVSDFANSPSERVINIRVRMPARKTPNRNCLQLISSAGAEANASLPTLGLYTFTTTARDLEAVLVAARQCGQQIRVEDARMSFKGIPPWQGGDENYCPPRGRIGYDVMSYQDIAGIVHRHGGCLVDAYASFLNIQPQKGHTDGSMLDKKLRDMGFERVVYAPGKGPLFPKMLGVGWKCEK